jgi:dipeptidyl aminopeptidase/acylaminoacyl peptidase
VTAAGLVRAQAVLESYSPSPDGTQVVVGIRRVTGNAYRSHLWVVPADGGRPRRLTDGAVRDTGPQVSPDGQWVAFVRAASRQPGAKGAETDEVGQAWMGPLDGSRKPHRLTWMRHGVDSVHWSPDCRSLALLGPAGEPRFVVGPQRDGVEPLARHVTRTDWRDDASGLVGRRTHLWVLDATHRGRRGPLQLTSGDFDVANPAWSPDGRWIAFEADMEPDWNIRYRYRIFRVRATGGPVRELVSLTGGARAPSYSPDGKWLAFLGTDVTDPSVADPERLWLATAAGRNPHCLTPDLDDGLGGWAWADLAMAEEVEAPQWEGSDALLVTVGRRGRVLPYRVPVPTGGLEPLVDETTRLIAGTVTSRNGRRFVSAALDGRASELYALTDRRLRRLTTFGSAWEDRFRRFELEELEFAGPGGPIQVWVASPRDAGATPLPTILHFHGGPNGAWGPGGTMDSLLLTAHGYRVAMPNVRGSTTHGSAWIRAHMGKWGDADEADVLAVTDALVDRGLAEPGRMGLMGLSYGGYLTQWMAAATGRYRAAVAENGVGNVLSAWGESYFGVHYGRMYGQGHPLNAEGAAALWRQSPLSRARDIRTPLLLLQAGEDRNCPPSSNEQLFVALKVLGRETEWVLYPEEHHEMKNYGRPDRRIDRMERHLAWFERHLSRAGARRHRSGSRRRRRDGRWNGGRRGLPGEPFGKAAHGEGQSQADDAEGPNEPERLPAEGRGQGQVGDNPGAGQGGADPLEGR